MTKWQLADNFARLHYDRAKARERDGAKRNQACTAGEG